MEIQSAASSSAKEMPSVAKVTLVKAECPRIAEYLQVLLSALESIKQQRLKYFQLTESIGSDYNHKMCHAVLKTITRFDQMIEHYHDTIHVITCMNSTLVQHAQRADVPREVAMATAIAIFTNASENVTRMYNEDIAKKSK